MQRHDVASTFSRRCINVMCRLGMFNPPIGSLSAQFLKKCHLAEDNADRVRLWNPRTEGVRCMDLVRWLLRMTCSWEILAHDKRFPCGIL